MGPAMIESGEELYIVSYSNEEDYDPTLVVGPHVADWEAFCDSLLNDAADLALRRKGPDGELGGSWIGWDTLREMLVEVLLTKGYREVRPKLTNYTGTLIIDDFETDGHENLDKDILTRIVMMNGRLKEKMTLRHEKELRKCRKKIVKNKV